MHNMTRKSELNGTYKVTAEKWVLTLARKTTGSHKQHAFFILEGINNEGNDEGKDELKAVTWFIDLVGEPLLPNLKSSKIRICKYIALSEENLKANPLIFRCDRVMLNLDENSEIASKQWWIPKDIAESFIEGIKEEKKNPPVFNILGNSSFFTSSSATSSSKEKGHSCFSWSKEKIKNLNNDEIKLEETDLERWVNKVANITSLALPYKETGSFSYASFWKPEVVVAGVATLAAGVAIGAVASTYFKK